VNSDSLALSFVFEQAEYVAMHMAIEDEEEGVDEQEGQVITEIREELSGSSINVDHSGCLFSDIDTFVKLSQGNTSITKVCFNPYDNEGDDALWEKMGEGLANLKSLELFIMFDEEINDDEQAPRPDFRTLAIVLPYLRQDFSFVIYDRNIIADYSREEVKVLPKRFADTQP
jgi:hypothetical protein